jgi:hypothetical protein
LIVNQEKVSAARTGIPLSEGHKENISIGTKDALADPDVRKRMSESHEGIPRPQWVRDKIGAGNTGKVRTTYTRKKVSCSRQGISLEEFDGFVKFEPYCEKFDEPLKDNIRQFFGNKCAKCGKHHRHNIDKRGKIWNLSIHHVFIEKLACCETAIEEKNAVRARLPLWIARFGDLEFSEEEIKYIRMMVPLCLGCHGIMNGEPNNIPYEESIYRKFFTELILSKYEGMCYSNKKIEMSRKVY